MKLLLTLLPPPRRGLVRGAIVYAVSVTLTFAAFGVFFGVLAGMGAP